MICVPAKSIHAKSKTKPVAYLKECRELASINEQYDLWCYTELQYEYLKNKYSRYAVSEASKFKHGDKISGCCDRADQY